jgi:hypothetical protein
MALPAERHFDRMSNSFNHIQMLIVVTIATQRSWLQVINYPEIPSFPPFGTAEIAVKKLNAERFSTSARLSQADTGSLCLFRRRFLLLFRTINSIETLDSMWLTHLEINTSQLSLSLKIIPLILTEQRWSVLELEATGNMRFRVWPMRRSWFLCSSSTSVGGFRPDVRFYQ